MRCRTRSVRYIACRKTFLDTSSVCPVGSQLPLDGKGFLFSQNPNFVVKKRPKTYILWCQKILQNFLKKCKKMLAICGCLRYYSLARVWKRVFCAYFHAPQDCTICDDAGGCDSWSRFFRGVCPILNRAKEYCVQRPTKRDTYACPTGITASRLASTVGLCVQDAMPTRGSRTRVAVFFTGRVGTPGRVYGFSVARQRKL